MKNFKKKNFILILLSVIAALCLCICMFACSVSNESAKFKLNFIVDGEVYATIDTNGEENISLPKNPTKDEYVFDGWYWDKDVWQRPFTASSLLEEKLTSDMSVYAKWTKEDVTKRSFNVTFNSMGGSNVEVVTVKYGNLIPEPKKPTKTGYALAGWYKQIDMSEEWNFKTDTVTEDITLYAKWVAEADATGCDILKAEGFEMSGNTLTITVDNSQDRLALSNLITVSPYATWNVSSDISGSSVITSATVSLAMGDNTYYINVTSGNGTNKKQYTANIHRTIVYTVTYQPNNGESVLTESVEEGNTAQNKTVTKTGYSFKEWQYNGAVWNFGTKITEDITLEAVWDVNDYEVTFDSNDGNDIQKQAVTYDAEFTFEVPVKTGYTFKGWKTNGGDMLTDSAGKGLTAWSIAENITVYADWEAVEYTITYNNIENATHTNTDKYTVEQEDITLTPATKAGYDFKGWFTEQECENQVQTIDVSEAVNVTLWAKWEATKYTATFKFEDGEEQQVEFTIEMEALEEPPVPQKNGYTGAWEDYTIKPQDITINAVYTAIEYNIIYKDTKDAENPNPDTYNIEDDMFALLPLEATGYNFNGWYDDNGQVTQIEQGSYGEKTLTAHWEVVKYTITYQNTKESDNPNRTEYTIEDETFELEKLSALGYSFVCWYDSGTPITQIVHGSYGNKILTASWKVYSLEEIEIDESKLAVKETDEITAELFSATCMDSNGQPAEITVSFTGVKEAGQTITVLFIAQAEGAQPKRKTLSNVKVYGLPTLEVTNDDRNFINLSDQLKGSLFGASGKDTFGVATQIKVLIDGDYSAGQIVTAVIQSIDPAGNVTERRIQNVKVYGAPVITYNEQKAGISVNDSLSAELFSAAAQDSFGQSVQVKVARLSGTIAAGNTVTIRLSATDIHGNVTNIDLSIKVYGMPTITAPTKTDFKVEEDITSQSLGLTATDTYKQPLQITLEKADGEQLSGATLTYTAAVTDVAGNKQTLKITVKIYGTPTIIVGRKAVKDTETVDANVLKITASDSFDQPLEVTVNLSSGEFASGNAVYYTISATDKLGNVKTLENFEVKVYSQEAIKLSYLGGASQMVKLSSHGEEFSATATDIFGEACTITFETAEGKPLTAGTNTSLYIVATDAAGNFKKSELISDIKVYGMPTLALCPEFVYPTTDLTSLSTEFMVLDSFNQELFFQIKVQGQVEYGKYVTVIITATDVAGNAFSESIDYIVPDNGYNYKVNGSDIILVSYTGSDENIVVLNGCTEISQNVFADNTNIKTVLIPQTVTKIGVDAFRGCTSLESITVDESNSVYSSQNGIMYNKDKTQFIHIPQAVKGEVVIPNGITSIGKYAFYNCTSLTSVNFGKNSKLETIGWGAFEGCKSLTSINIPDSVTSIGAWAFEYCTNLTGVYITNLKAWCNIEFDGLGATPLYYADNLYFNDEPITDITAEMLQGVTKIKIYAFHHYTTLKSITIPDSVTSIGGFAFDACTNLTSVTISDSVTSIGNYAFYNCTSLTSVNFGKNSKLETIGDYAFEYCTSLISITIGNSVTSISKSAFYGCTSLISITIGNSVTSIGEYAFSGCTNIKSVIIPASVNSIGYKAFYNCTSLVSVTFEDKSDWRVSTNSDMSDEVHMGVASPYNNATHLKAEYSGYYWKLYKRNY